MLQLQVTLKASENMQAEPSLWPKNFLKCNQNFIFVKLQDANIEKYRVEKNKKAPNTGAAVIRIGFEPMTLSLEG